MNEERPYLQIPPPSPEDYRLYEEWVRGQKEQQDFEDEERVVVIDL